MQAAKRQPFVLLQVREDWPLWRLCDIICRRKGFRHGCCRTSSTRASMHSSYLADPELWSTLVTRACLSWFGNVPELAGSTMQWRQVMSKQQCGATVQENTADQTLGLDHSGRCSVQWHSESNCSQHQRIQTCQINIVWPRDEPQSTSAVAVFCLVLLIQRHEPQTANPSCLLL